MAVASDENFDDRKEDAMSRHDSIASVIHKRRIPPVSRTAVPLQTVFAALLAALAILAPQPCGAGDRLVVSASNDAEIGIRDRVREAARAVSEENLDTFVACFTERQRPQIRRRAALVFVKHTLDLELLDDHVVSDSGNRAELVVKYRMMLTDDAFDIVSLLGMVKEQGEWRIATEKVESNVPLMQNRSLSSCGGPVFRFGGGGDVIERGDADDFLPKDIGRAPGRGCANGRCGL